MAKRTIMGRKFNGRKEWMTYMETGKDDLFTLRSSGKKTKERI